MEWGGRGVEVTFRKNGSHRRPAKQRRKGERALEEKNINREERKMAAPKTGEGRGAVRNG